MKAVDTNILVRLIMRDDVDQLARAIPLCSGGVLVPLSVTLETEWVLRSRYKVVRADIAHSFQELLDSANFYFAREAGVRWALDRYRLGADFADMIHLLDAHDADGFATFDEAFVADAGGETPLPVIVI